MVFECSICGFAISGEQQSDSVINACPNCGHVSDQYLAVVEAMFDRTLVRKRLKDAVRLFSKREYTHAARSALTTVENYVKTCSGVKVDFLDAISDVMSYQVEKTTGTVERVPKT